MDLHQILPLPRKMTLSRCPTPATRLHVVTTWRSPDNAIRKNTQHDTSKVLRVPRNMNMDTSKVLHRKMIIILWNWRKKTAPARHATQKDFRHVMKHVGMSRSATPGTRNEAMQGLKLPKVRTFAELAIGTAIQPSRGRLRTIANGCERLCNVWRTQPQPPNPQWNGNPWNRNPCYAFEKKIENNNTKKKNRTARTSKDWRGNREQSARQTVSFYLQHPPRKSKSKCLPKSW